MLKAFKLPEAEREHLFARGIGRRWRLDFAWPHIPVIGSPQMRFAVEIEGIVWYRGKKSRHQTARGFVEDAEKYEAALRLGWIVYRVPHTWIETGGKNGRCVWRPEVIETIRQHVGVDRAE